MRFKVVKLASLLGTAILLQPALAQSDGRPQWEESFQATVSTESIDGFIKDMTAHPTFPGSPWDKRNAQKTLELFRSWGWDARIETLQVMFPTPAERAVELLGSLPFKAELHEPPVPGDPYSEQQSEHLPSYFVYGPDGDVTAPLVYANYGLREDYDELSRLGVSPKNAIVLVRAGRMWRGGKVQLAAEHGAKAVLIYSDPIDDGYYLGATYPQGGWRNGDSVQRGAILNGVHAGDPLKPFNGPNAGKQVPIGDPDSSMARIPAMPLSYSDAEPFLRALRGPTAPHAWKGAMPITYRAGPGPDVRLRIRYNWAKTTLYNVIATLRGSTYPDEWIVRGNHRDGWVYGAQDPHSGHAAMLEEARVLGGLLKQGWKPKRTLVYASWDAEEQGTLGSAGWVNAHLADLQKHAVVYINTDVTGPGSLRPAGAASFTDFLTSVASTVTDPNSGVSALDRLRVQAEKHGAVALTRDSGALALTGGDANYYDLDTRKLRLAPPGYGSDHHPFVSRAGIPSLGLEFAGQINLGSYHSAYDDYSWFKLYGDPGFKYIKATAQIDGVTVLRLAAADLLPQTFTATAKGLDREFDDLARLYKNDREKRIADNRDLDLGITKILNDPANPRLPPKRREVENLDLSSIEHEMAEVRRAAAQFDEVKAMSYDVDLDASEIQRANHLIMEIERAFLRSGGLPRRRYYENEFFSPGRLWDTVPMPAVGDAILDDQWDEARQQVPLVAATLRRISGSIDSARTYLSNVHGASTSKP